MLTRCTLLFPSFFSFVAVLLFSVFCQRALAGQHTGPPPGPEPGNPLNWITDEAQLGLPDAPLVFSGEPLRVGASFSTARLVAIDRDAHIEVAGGARLELAGTVSSLDGSEGRLVKTGAGTLALSADNNYLGHTRLMAGRLQIQGHNALGGGLSSLWMRPGTTLSYAAGTVLSKSIQLDPGQAPDDPAPQAALLHVPQGVATQAGAIVGPLPLVKQGSGTLVLAGSAHAAAGLDVEAGTLRNLMMINGPVTVRSGARLEGGGSLGATTVQGGATLAPGAPAASGRPGTIGTLAVAGRLHLLPGAELAVKVLPDGGSDQVMVVGKALLDGRLSALAGEGDWRPSTRYTVVHALGGFEGTRFESAGSNLAFLDPELSYSDDDTRAFLTLVRNDTRLDEVGDTETEDEVAVVIDPVKPVTPVRPVEPLPPIEPVAPAAPPDAAETDVDIPVDDPVVIVVDSEPEAILHDEILVMTAPEAKTALRQLSGSWHASLRSGMLEDSRHIREAALRHLGRGEGHWLQGWHSNGWRGAAHGTPADWRDLHGMALGSTRNLAAHWRATVFLGAQRGDWRRHPATAHARIDGVHAGIALLKELTVTDLAVGVAKTWNRVQASRSVSAGGMHYALAGVGHGYTLQVFTELAAPLRRLAKLHRHPALKGLTPFIRAAWVRDSLHGYDERGGAAALTMLRDRRSVVFTTLGVQADYALQGPKGAMRLQGELAWRHAGGDTHARSQQYFRDGTRRRVFASEGQAIARQAWSLKLGMEGDLGRDLRLSVGYAGQYARRQKDHGLRVAVAWVF